MPYYNKNKSHEIKRNKIFEVLKLLFIYFVIASILNFPFFTFGSNSYLPHGDWFGFDFPNRQIVANSLLNGDIFNLNKNVLTGITGNLNGQTIDFFNIPYLFPFPAWLAIAFQSIIIDFSEILGMYIFLRYVIGLKKIEASIGGICYSIIAINTPIFGLGFTSIPILASILLTCEKRSTKWNIFLSITTGVLFSISSGLMWTIPFYAPIACITCIILSPNKRYFSIVLTGIFIASAFLARGPLFFELILASNDSHRTSFNSAIVYGDILSRIYTTVYWQILEQKWLIATLLIPTIVLRNKKVFQLFSLLIFVLSLSPVWNIVRVMFFVDFKFNAINFYFHYTTAFLIVTISAISWQAFDSKKMLAAIRLIFVALFIFLTLKIAFENIKKELSATRSTSNEYLSFTKNSTLFSLRKISSDFRVGTIVNSNTPEISNIPLIYDLASVDGYTSSYPLRYKQYWVALSNGAFELDTGFKNKFLGWGNRVQLRLPSGIDGSHVKFWELYNKNLLSLAGAKYFLVWNKFGTINILDMKKLNFVNAKPDATNLDIYLNEDALPRYRVVTEFKAFDNEEQILTEMRFAKTEELKTTVYVNKKSNIALNAIKNNSSAKPIINTEDKLDSFSAEVESEGGLYFITNYSYQPNWTCRTSFGSTLQTDIINYAFLGLRVPAGKIEFKCSYENAFTILCNRLLQNLMGLQN